MFITKNRLGLFVTCVALLTGLLKMSEVSCQPTVTKATQCVDTGKYRCHEDDVCSYTFLLPKQNGDQQCLPLQQAVHRIQGIDVELEQTRLENYKLRQDIEQLQQDNEQLRQDNDEMRSMLTNITEIVIELKSKVPADYDNNGDGNRNMNGTDGSIYVRWGRKTCPDTAELVYDGVVGGSHYTESGGGSNYQCLPLDPIYDEPMSGTDELRGRMYGTEYDTGTYPPLSSLMEHDAVCAVCRVRTRGTVLMIPARNECPSQEWTREYYGYLMAQRHDLERSEFVCVDRNPELIIGSHANLNGQHFYPVEGRCGSLPCPPYVDGNELTCAVCTI